MVERTDTWMLLFTQELVINSPDGNCTRVAHWDTSASTDSWHVLGISHTTQLHLARSCRDGWGPGRNTASTGPRGSRCRSRCSSRTRSGSSRRTTAITVKSEDTVSFLWISYTSLFPKSTDFVVFNLAASETSLTY